MQKAAPFVSNETKRPSFFRFQGTETDKNSCLRHDWNLHLADAGALPRPASGPLRRLPLHGGERPQGDSVHRSSAPLLHAEQVSARPRLPSSDADIQGAPVHRDSAWIPDPPLDSEEHEGDKFCLPNHGERLDRGKINPTAPIICGKNS